MEAIMDRGRRYRQTPMARTRRRMRVRPLLVCALAVCLAASVISLTVYFIQSARNRAEQTELAAAHQAEIGQENTAAGIVSVMETEPIPTFRPTAAAPDSTWNTIRSTPFFQVIGVTRKSFKPLVARNADIVGWISIEGIVDQPIVYRNNTFYINHDFDQQKNVSGAIFLDENHPLRADSQNLLLYGHNMKDESMFGQLQKYMQDNFLHAHSRMTLETRFETFSYLIFAVNSVSLDESSPRFLYFWGHPSFGSSEAFQSYIDEVYQKSMYTRYLAVDATDTLLTLATCIGEDRLVLFARRQRAGETEADIQSALLKLTMR
jgi:sortase B